MQVILGISTNKVHRKFKEILEPFRITMFYTDDWVSYHRNLDSLNHAIRKRNTRTIERKNLTLRTRIKRLTANCLFL